MINLLKSSVLIIIILMNYGLRAQEIEDTLHTPSKVLVKMLNGDEYIGNLITRSKEKVVLDMPNGELNLNYYQIVSIEPYIYKGEFGYDNPHATRYYFSPSGMPIHKGKGYYQNLMVSSNFINYGVTSNVSIGGGFEFISLLVGYPIWFFSPKIAFNISEKVHVGTGIFMAGIYEEGIAALAYGVFTLGSTETNATVGVAYGFFDWQASKYPVINFAGTHRVKHNLAFLTENYIITSDDGDVIYMGVHGVRIMSSKNAFDIGLIVGSEFDSELPAFPFVGYSRAF